MFPNVPIKKQIQQIDPLERKVVSLNLTNGIPAVEVIQSHVEVVACLAVVVDSV